MSGFILVFMAVAFTLGAFILAMPTVGWMAAVSWAITGVYYFMEAYNSAVYPNFWQNWQSYLALVAFLGFTTVMMMAAIGWKTSNEKDESPDNEDDQDNTEPSDTDIEERSERRRGLLWKVRDARRERTRNLKNQAVLRKTNARIARGG